MIFSFDLLWYETYHLHFTLFYIIYMHQFGWLEERGANFFNLLQKEGGSNPGALEETMTFLKIQERLSEIFNMITGLDGNKLVQVRNIVHHFYLSHFRHVVMSTLKRTKHTLQKSY